MQVIRGSTVVFETTFTDQDGVPIVASNEVDGPQVEIKDPDNETIWTGNASHIGDGKYVVQWFCPEDLELNTNTRQYRIRWYLTDLYQHTHTSEGLFSVVDTVIPDQADVNFTYLTRQGKRERVVLSLDYEPENISVKVMSSGFKELYGSCELAIQDDESLETTPINDRKIGHVVKNGVHYYWFVTEPLTVGEYPVFWDVLRDKISQEESFHQTIRVPENNFWLLVKPLQLFIDKVRKKYVTFQAYSTDQLYEFISRGLGTVNGINPITNYTLDTIPTANNFGLTEAVILAAAKWALIAQQTLEEEMAFDHSGQTVSLSVKHDYSGIIGLIDSLLEKFSESKLMLQRITCKVGVTGVRPYRYGYSNRVWKMGYLGSPQDTFNGLNILLATMNS